MEQLVAASKKNLYEYKELRLLVGEIVEHHLTVRELKLLHWILKLSEQVFEEDTPSVAVLHALEKRSLIQEWSENPSMLIKILKNTLHRDDLAFQVQKWSGKSV